MSACVFLCVSPKMIAEESRAFEMWPEFTVCCAICGLYKFIDTSSFYSALSHIAGNDRAFCKEADSNILLPKYRTV